MKGEKLEFYEGSGNIYRDFSLPDADVRQLRVILAARIVKLLDKQRLTVRAAHARTAIAAADFSRIRNADLSRFTIDRLITIINRLGSQVDVTVIVRPSKPVVASRKRKAVA